MSRTRLSLHLFFFKIHIPVSPLSPPLPFLPSLSSQPLTSRDKRNSPDMSLPSHPKGRPPVPLPNPNRLLHLPPPLSCHLFTCDVIVPKSSLKDFFINALYLLFCDKQRWHFKAFWVPDLGAQACLTKSSPRVLPLEDQQCGVSNGCSIFLK